LQNKNPKTRETYKKITERVNFEETRIRNAVRSVMGTRYRHVTESNHSYLVTLRGPGQCNIVSYSNENKLFTFVIKRSRSQFNVMFRL
jgi:negative regulator of sigma E activity